MGVFLGNIVSNIKGFGITDKENSVLQELAKDALDDNNCDYQDGLRRGSLIGQHMICDATRKYYLTTLSFKTGYTEEEVATIFDSLVEKQLVKHDEVLKINVSKIIRLYICKETFSAVCVNPFDVSSSNKQRKQAKIKNSEKCMMFIDSALQPIPGDFDDPWINDAKMSAQLIQRIYNWKDIINRTLEQQEAFWLDCKKNIQELQQNIQKLQQDHQNVLLDDKHDDKHDDNSSREVNINIIIENNDPRTINIKV